MAEKKDKGFRVVDRRHSSADAPTTPTPEPAKQGDGFTMQSNPEEKQKQSAESPPLRKIDFSTFVVSLANVAVISLGLVPDPVTNETTKNVELAKQNIDILEILQQKTQGNLTDQEKGLLDNLLTEVRLQYVEATK